MQRDPAAYVAMPPPFGKPIPPARLHPLQWSPPPPPPPPRPS